MSTTASPQFNTDAIGVWSQPAEFEVTRERAMAYARATNDDIPQHASGELAPPVLAIVPAFELMGQVALGVIPGELLGMILHGEQDFHFHRPLVPGMTVVTRGQISGLQPRSSGVTVVAKLETIEKQTGEPVCTQYAMSFVRGAVAAEAIGEEAPPHAFPAQLRSQPPLATVTQTFDADQTYRYSEASGDPMPIHLDDEFAKAMGLPGIIIHGLCTMAFTARAVIQTACPDDPSRLKRLAGRFSKPVQPRQSITTHIRANGEHNGRAAYAYETEGPDGALVIKDGLAEIANS